MTGGGAVEHQPALPRPSRLRAVGWAGDAEPLPPLDRNGKAGPVTAYVLHELRPARAGLRSGGA